MIKVINCPSSNIFLLAIHVKPAATVHSKKSNNKMLIFLLLEVCLIDSIPQKMIVMNTGINSPAKTIPRLEFVNTNKMHKQKEIVPKSSNIYFL